MAPPRIWLSILACCLFLGIASARAAEPTRQQRIAALPDDDRVWLTDFVAPIILPEEEKAFLQLTDATQREGFKEDFWQRREVPGLPLPLGPGYRDRYRDLRQVLDAKYIGWSSDAGRLILRRGEPDSILKPKCEGEEVFKDLEVWTYNALELNGHPAQRHIFYRSSAGAARRLWLVHDGNAAPFLPNACRASFDQLASDCRPPREDRCSRCADRCLVYEAWAEILKRQGGPAGALAEQGDLFNYPKISTTGLDRPKARWAAAAATAKAPAGAVSPVPTPTAVPRPTLPPTPTAVPRPTMPPPTPTAVPRPTVPPPTPTAVPRPTVPPPTPTPVPRPTLPPPTPTAAPRPTAVPAVPPPAARQPAASPTPPAARQPAPVPASTAVREPSASPSPQPTRTAVVTPSRTATLIPTLSRPTPTPTRSPTLVPTKRPPAGPSPTPVPTPAGGGLRTRLSADEIRALTESLEPEYKQFLDLAQPLLSQEQLSRFLQLSGHDKDAFIRDFWKRNS